MSNSILVVDDETHILRSVRRLLRREGYEIHLAESGPAGLEILANNDISVIICDQRMPGMMGAEVLATAFRQSPDTVRITMTGYTDLTAAQASINEGHVNHFLLKPWDDDHLLQVVGDAVRSHSLVRENRRLEALTRKQKEELEVWSKSLEAQVVQRTEELIVKNEELTRFQLRLEQALRGSVTLLVGTLEAASPNLGIHCRRVARRAREVAVHLGLDEEAVRDIEVGAHLHDLGKLPSLSNPRRKERLGSGAAKAVHSEAGFTILSKVSGFEEVALAVRHQKEHFDGDGSPDGLKGKKIPLASRIIAVSNAFDVAMFRSGDPSDVSREAGIEALARGRGKQFDPTVVDALLQHFDEVGTDNDEDTEVELSPRRIRTGMVLSRPIHNHNGVLLLKSDTCLTPAFIERIRSMDGLDPLFTSVFVKCCTETDSGEGGATEAGQSDCETEAA